MCVTDCWIDLSVHQMCNWFSSCSKYLLCNQNNFSWEEHNGHSLHKKFNMAFRIWIKCIATAKCDLFFHCHDTKEITFYYFRDQNFVKTKKKQKQTNNKRKHVNFIYVVEIMFVRQMNGVVDCFHCKFRVFIQIMVRDYCIAKCKKLFACKGDFLWFKNLGYFQPCLAVLFILPRQLFDATQMLMKI